MKIKSCVWQFKKFFLFLSSAKSILIPDHISEVDPQKGFYSLYDPLICLPILSRPLSSEFFVGWFLEPFTYFLSRSLVDNIFTRRPYNNCRAIALLRPPPQLTGNIYTFFQKTIINKQDKAQGTIDTAQPPIQISGLLYALPKGHTMPKGYIGGQSRERRRRRRTVNIEGSQKVTEQRLTVLLLLSSE